MGKGRVGRRHGVIRVHSACVNKKSSEPFAFVNVRSVAGALRAAWLGTSKDGCVSRRRIFESGTVSPLAHSKTKLIERTGQTQSLEVRVAIELGN